MAQLKRPWALELCDCMEYRDKQGEKQWCPHMCPIALFLTGITAGQVCSKIENEKPICFDMGSKGCLVCCVTTPISFYSIPGGVGLFFFLSWYQRNRVLEKWNVIEEDPCCFGPCNPCCNFCHTHCNYPCSFFQMYMSIKEYEQEASNSVKPIVVIANPIN